MPNFQASLINTTTNVADITVNDGCTTFTVVDSGNYAVSDEVGHLLADFSDYRKLTIIRPSVGAYVYSSLGDGDASISTPDSTNNTVNYQFAETDVDGIFEVQVCAYPTYNPAAAYGATPSDIIVYYDGNLYKSLQASTGSQPDTNPLDWELYDPTPEDELLTRYCTVAKMVVLCISLLKCQETLIHEAFCLIDSDFCNDDILCKNKKFLAAVKARTILDAMTYSVNRQAWNEVNSQVNLLKTICNC